MISIIVPIYNKEKYIHECMETLLNQTYRELEIILVDDGSTDSSGKICDQYAVQDSRVKVIHKPNGGLVSAWRAGSVEATGDYISYVDCDDWVDLDMYEKLVACTSGRDDEIISSDYVIERTDGTQTYIYQNIASGEYVGEKIKEDVIPLLWGLEERAICRSRCMKLFSSQLIRDNARYGDKRLRFSEDTSLTIPCLLDAGRIYVMDHEAMYHYRFVDDSMVHGYDKTMLESIELVQDITEKAISDKYLKEKAEELCKHSKKEFIFLLMYVVKNEAGGNPVDYVKNIKHICGISKYGELIKNTPVEVKHMSNKLVYFVMKHPNRFMCKILRTAILIKG